MPHRVGTPLIRLARWCPEGRLWVKAEHLLPTGSAFDRIAPDLIERFATSAPGETAVMAGGGSQCLAFAAAAAIRGVELVVVCPESTLGEHRILLRQYPCRVIATRAADGLHGAHEAAEVHVRESGGRMLFGPKDRADAADLFAMTLGVELAVQIGSNGLQVGALVAPVNSGALLEGAGRPLRRVPTLGTVADRATLQDGTVTHGEAPDIGAELVSVADRDAYDARRTLATTEGLLVGLASAGALWLARSRIASGALESAVSIAVDAGDRYFSRDAAFEAQA